MLANLSLKKKILLVLYLEEGHLLLGIFFNSMIFFAIFVYFTFDFQHTILIFGDVKNQLSLKSTRSFSVYVLSELSNQAK